MATMGRCGGVSFFALFLFFATAPPVCKEAFDPLFLSLFLNVVYLFFFFGPYENAVVSTLSRSPLAFGVVVVVVVRWTWMISGG
jgi:hypothetical protein